MAFDWGMAASVGGSLLGGAMGSSSAKKAASDAKKMAREANDMQMIARNEMKYDLQPFLNSGQEANSLLSEYLGISNPKGYTPKPTRDQVANEFAAAHYKRYGRNYSAKDSNMGSENSNIDKEYASRLADWENGLEQYKLDNPEDGTQGGNFGRLLKEFTNEDFVKDPGYNFRMDEGNKGIDRQLAARGGLNSGSALKSIARYNQDFASNEFGNAFNRDSANKSNIYNMLSGQSAQGLQAAGTKAGMLQNSANAQSNNLQQAGNNATNLNMQGSDSLNQGIQSAIGNYIYGTERAKDRSILGRVGSSTNAYQGASYV
jgi:hypothetical protein